MKHAIIMAVVAMGFLCQPSAAQEATANTNSQANNTANQISASGAASFGNSINIEAAESVRTTSVQEGTAKAELKNVPALGGLALGGGHPCAYSPVTAQFSIVGGGAGAGGMRIDSACMLMVAAAQAGDAKAYNAAMYMMASRDPAACDAMEAAGYNIECAEGSRDRIYRREATPVLSTRNVTRPEPRPVAYSKCVMEDNKVIFRKASGFSSETARAQCLAKLGY